MPKTTNGGKLGEDQAANFLEQKGFQIIARNYRYGKCEIDIIAKKDNLLIFTEVKLRAGTKFGYPEASVSRKQQIRIQKAADQYIFKTGWHGPIRFDIISILIEREIVHFEDAY